MKILYPDVSWQVRIPPTVIELMFREQYPYWRLVPIALAAILCLGADNEENRSATIQDIRVAGRVLSFQNDRPSGALTVAVPYAAGDVTSRTEANEIASLIGDGLLVGRLVLHATVVSQEQLAAGHYDAVFATAGLDNAVLKNALIERHVPCLTLHESQVARGPCVIAIRSTPNVVITLNNANASSIGVRFATAFRMMVTEL